jgi:hypothetical protein
MRVTVPDKSAATLIVAEMVESGDIGHIAEMVGKDDVVKIDNYVPGASQTALALATACKDEEPEFPIVRVEEGWSNNKRLWDGQELDNIARQVTQEQPVGHWGHPNFNNMAWEAPDPQTTWVAAITKDEPSEQKERLGQIVRVFYAVGYNLPGAKIRTNIKAKAVRGISWLCGRDSKQIPVPGKGVQMRDVKLLSLDWAKKLAEGMPGTAIVGVASEMKGEEGMDVEVSKLTPALLEEHNPNLVTLLKQQGAQESETVVAEMEAKVESAEGDVSLIARMREALGVDASADLLAIVTALKDKSVTFTKDMFEGLLDKVLEGKVPDEKARPAIRRLIVADTPVAEMTTLNTEELVAEMVGEKFDKDEVIRDMVAEDAAVGRAPARRSELRSQGDGKTDNKYARVGTAKL